MNSIQKKVAREKQRYSNLLDEYHKLQSSQSTDKPSQLDTSQQEDHDKSEELQTSRSLDEDTVTELTKLQLKMEDVSISLEKVDTVKKYWEQVCIHTHYMQTLCARVQYIIVMTKSIKHTAGNVTGSTKTKHNCASLIYSINHWSRRVSCGSRNQYATL